MTETHLAHAACGRIPAGSGRGGDGRSGLRHLTALAQTLGRGLLDFTASIAHGLRAYRRCQTLEMMSDGELARMGIDRRDIVRHVMLGPQEDQTR